MKCEHKHRIKAISIPIKETGELDYEELLEIVTKINTNDTDKVLTWFEVLVCIDCNTVLEQNDVFIPNCELKFCWNCAEDEETGNVGDDGLCCACRELYQKDGTTFERCIKCDGLIEYGGKNKTKCGDGCKCNEVK